MESETPRTDAVAQNFHVIAATEKTQCRQYILAAECRTIERERNEAVLKNKRLEAALIILINLTEGLADGGVGITGEDWEIASYAIQSLENDKSPPTGGHTTL